MKSKILIFLTVFLLMFSTNNKPLANANENKISISCSFFPIYDFAREIVKDYADVKLLLRPGVEPHEFEPSPMDIKVLNDSEVFIFAGKNLEHWAERISQSLSNTLIIEASENIEILDNDPHIWLDMNKAVLMLENILKGICEADPAHSEIYKNNAEIYMSKLKELDEKFMALNKNKTLVFAGEFSYNYFVKRYGFNYVSAYEGENEPSLKSMAEVLKFIRENRVKYIFADKFGISKITQSISEQTGTEILTFNSAHMVDGEADFIDIMNENYKNLELALND
ncbi:MAG: zinc ABC transporter substrate-binding protein [Synergistaceae bacterium]|nr:zinc ABC transporter substrate-binding protein [Synergistaceae bacterium]